MRILIQRVTEAAVEVGGEVVSRIGRGMLLLVGVEEADGAEDIAWLVGKVARLRIFDDPGGVMNLDVVQTRGEVLAVSQFTLYASTLKGNRPSYIRAARPQVARPLYEQFVARLSREIGRPVGTGVFGAEMQVRLTGDGPVTIWLDSKAKE